MSALDDAEALVSAWLAPLGDESAPCGPDLEYEPEFLALTQAAAGKPETQFGPGEPPDWRTVQQQSEDMLGRSRDLRLAIHWLRSGLHQRGYGALAPGLRLLTGLLNSNWDQVHPLPDDGDAYARVNALSLLCSNEALIGDFRAAIVGANRAVGQVTGRDVELAAGLAQPLEAETAPAKDQLARLLAAIVEQDASVRDQAQACLAAVQELQSAINDHFESSDAPDLKPLLVLAKAVVGLMPGDAEAAEADMNGSSAGVGSDAGSGRGLSGAVRSRDEALRAIDMVCAFLERTEPSNPAPLFLRRARQLVNHNFLQLMKELAPSVMPDVARIVGVDPDSV